MSSSRSKSDLVELKRQAMEYYSMNSDIPKRVEEALNSLFYESPYDAFGYLVNHFICIYIFISFLLLLLNFLILRLVLCEKNLVRVFSKSFKARLYQPYLRCQAYNSRRQISAHF